MQTKVFSRASSRSIRYSDNFVLGIPIVLPNKVIWDGEPCFPSSQYWKNTRKSTCHMAQSSRNYKEWNFPPSVSNKLSQLPLQRGTTGCVSTKLDHSQSVWNNRGNCCPHYIALALHIELQGYVSTSDRCIRHSSHYNVPMNECMGYRRHKNTGGTVQYSKNIQFWNSNWQ